jgi:hypothetical protein
MSVSRGPINQKIPSDRWPRFTVSEGGHDIFTAMRKAQGDHVKQFVNGKLANEGSQAFPASGKILLQSEGAEVYFRKIELFPLKR